MRRVLLLLSLFALASCKEEPTQGAVKLTVTYSGFRPRCVLVLARDTASGKELSKTVEGKGEPSGGSLVVAVLPPDDWGSAVAVEARAFERAGCEGNPVASQASSATLTPGVPSPVTLTLTAVDDDGDGFVSPVTNGTDCQDKAATIYPGAEERCNDVDDNCDGVLDVTTFQLGQSCREGDSCQGTYRCNASGAAYCDLPTATLAYPDVDRDGHGKKDATAERFCGAVPAGYTTGAADDCDDSRMSVRPGAQELCNDVDDDCDGTEDEDYAAQLGMACTTSQKCAGRNICDTSTGTAVTCMGTEDPTAWYLDGDSDNYGGATVVQSCQRPSERHLAQGGDCNDGNRFTRPGAQELCDQEDNDCNAATEDTSVCPAGGPRWAARVIPGGAILSGISLWGDGGVWVSGTGGALAVKKPEESAFTSRAGICDSSPWYGIWADPRSGRAYLGGTNGRLGIVADADATSCQRNPPSARSDTWGLVGFADGSGVKLFGAGYIPPTVVLPDGHAFVWDGTASAVTVTLFDLLPRYDIHGLVNGPIFAVGANAVAQAAIHRFDAMQGTWVRMTDGVSGGMLNAVRVVHPQLAYAVGNNGTVLKWEGGNWAAMTTKPTNDHLGGVEAFGPSAVYVASRAGKIYRFNGAQWSEVGSPGGSLFRMAGTHPGDLWVVGDGGRVIHWPQ
ncbi:putative metal-binding motif-containing protein [Pyxidicoccus xibeiensis]|uniref:putative metal-binding motif-containing protein n=1 Tax=Pyxidicoccus xibeiensis TaxID=2906759 RepID=UPI0020A820BC|nr:putative metal-binding motif-containing protein [Pyxidicoccus xibeiensis]MCP3139509.1 putative metal-binding motif-containing protein [Pyxidicoccus xibeiensis]